MQLIVDQSISKNQSFSLKVLQCLALLLIVFSMVNGVAVDHCYSDIGCFPLSEEFYHPRHRPFNVRPWHRSRIKTRFELYNKRHPDGYLLEPWNSVNLRYSGFNPRLETKVIIPGWLDNIKRATWVRKMKDAFQWFWAPTNLIVIHWRNFTPYTIATANTRVVGAELANLIKFIEHELNYNRAHYHIIGHSLGAHIGGYTGDRLPGLGRITALDPARPFFQHMPKSVRLDRADAKFVDAIHSDFTPENAIFLLMSFGMTTPVGHVDFYPNGPPLLQPGCLRDTLFSVQNGIRKGLEHSSLSVAFLEAIRYLTACDHQRSHEWFIESILNRQCVFVGVRCNEYEGLINGRCTCDDSRSACAIMGIHADQMYLHKAHKDVWPLKRPYQAALNIPRPKTKEEIYANMKLSAAKMRYPSASPSIMSHDYNDPIPLHQQFDKLIDDTISSDIAFIDYLRANLLVAGGQKSHLPETTLPLPFSPLPAPPAPYLMDIDQEPALGQLEEFLFSSRSSQPPSQMLQTRPYQPNLMSDVDRDIENWYEDSSRWYLKTNNRPSYCVNQYQVLVFIGPLKTMNGRERLRANLLISIIGTRGQLMNQRFVPRSAQLDSYTMQPFFILLEGTYSLGRIKSVAIGWEQRYDPDPIQATISFQSNLLESVQPHIPAYKAKHPWLSETIQYDHSQAFRWPHDQSPVQEHHTDFGGGLLSQLGIHLNRRSSGSSTHHTKGCDIDSGGKTLECSASGSGNSPIIQKRSSLSAEDVLFDGNLDPILTEESASDDDYDDIKISVPLMKPTIITNSDLNDANTHLGLEQLNEERPYDPVHAANSGKITADLHNIDGFLNQEHSEDNTIVINEVIVSPIEASYGNNGKVGRIFCPPHPNFKLRQDRTVKLVPNDLLGRCHRQRPLVSAH